MSRSGAEADAGASSKEEIMQIIGTTWREQRKKEHEARPSRRRPERKAGHDPQSKGNREGTPPVGALSSGEGPASCPLLGWERL